MPKRGKGRPLGSRDGPQAPRRIAREKRYPVIEVMWAEGLGIAPIAEELGVKYEAIHYDLKAMRKAGWNVPKRDFHQRDYWSYRGL